MRSRKEIIRNRLCILIIIAISLALNMTLQNHADDFVFQKGIEAYGGLAGWLRFYAENWSGRLIPHGIFVVLQNLPDAIFFILNSVAFALLPIMLVRCLFPVQMRGDAKFELGLFLLLILFIPQSVFEYTVFWKCSSVLYLWGIVSMLFAMMPFVDQYRGNDKIGIGEFILATLGGIYASNFEQVAAFLMVFMVIMVVWNKLALKEKVGKCVVVIVITVASTLFFSSMQGNQVRYFTEVIQRISNYDMYSVWDKLLMGIWYLLTSIQGHCTFLFCALSLIVTACLCRRHGNHHKWAILVGGAYRSIIALR